LLRYRSANLFFLVLPRELFREPEIPLGWGALAESNGVLELVCKPVWQESPPEKRLQLLQRIAAAGTRALIANWKSHSTTSSSPAIDLRYSHPGSVEY
jgi:hypothetical protein